MDNILGAVFGIVLLIVGIALFPIGFSLYYSLGGVGGGIALAVGFLGGIVLLSAALPLPIFLLERFEGVRDSSR